VYAATFIFADFFGHQHLAGGANRSEHNAFLPAASLEMAPRRLIRPFAGQLEFGEPHAIRTDVFVKMM